MKKLVVVKVLFAVRFFVVWMLVDARLLFAEWALFDVRLLLVQMVLMGSPSTIVVVFFGTRVDNATPSDVQTIPGK